jgi:hypothetical protein
VSHFRLRWAKLGGHVHVHVWAGTSAATTHGKNGTLVFTEQEWDDLRDMIGGAFPGFIEIVAANETIGGTIVGDPYTWESGT